MREKLEKLVQKKKLLIGIIVLLAIIIIAVVFVVFKNHNSSKKTASQGEIVTNENKTTKQEKTTKNQETTKASETLSETQPSESTTETTTVPETTSKTIQKTDQSGSPDDIQDGGQGDEGDGIDHPGNTGGGDDNGNGGNNGNNDDGGNAGGAAGDGNSGEQNIGEDNNKRVEDTKRREELFGFLKFDKAYMIVRMPNYYKELSNEFHKYANNEVSEIDAKKNMLKYEGHEDSVVYRLYSVDLMNFYQLDITNLKNEEIKPIVIKDVLKYKYEEYYDNLITYSFFLELFIYKQNGKTTMYIAESKGFMGYNK